MFIIHAAIKNSIKEAELVVCKYFDVDSEVFFRRNRASQDVAARFALYFLLNKKLGISCNRIAKYYMKDHSSILHGVRRAKEEGIDAMVGGLTVDYLWESPPDQSKKLGKKVGKHVDDIDQKLPVTRRGVDTGEK